MSSLSSPTILKNSTYFPYHICPFPELSLNKEQGDAYVPKGGAWMPWEDVWVPQRWTWVPREVLGCSKEMVGHSRVVKELAGIITRLTQLPGEVPVN